MRHSNILSYKFNTSLGFIPAIISMLLYLWNPQDIAIYTGTLIGVLTCLVIQLKKTVSIPQLFLYSTTGVLTIFSLFAMIADQYSPPLLVLSMEILILFPPTLFYFNKKRVIELGNRFSKDYQKLFYQGVEATLVSSKIIITLGLLHFLTITIIAFLHPPIQSTLSFFLFQVTPPALLILSIVLNQLCIFLFNKLSAHDLYLPVVDTEGNVINKIPLSEALVPQNQKIIPIIRIAISTHNMLYLIPRKHQGQEYEKRDLPIEGFLLFGESLEQGIRRLSKQFSPKIDIKDIHFKLKYHYKNHHVNQLVYLFLIDLKDDQQLAEIQHNEAKLWTLQQIEINLKNHLFSGYFEYEYEYLKKIIYTREKYKES